MSVSLPKRYVNIKNDKVIFKLYKLLEQLYPKSDTFPIEQINSSLEKILGFLIFLYFKLFLFLEAEKSDTNNFKAIENGDEKCAQSLSPTTTSTTTHQLSNQKKSQNKMSHSSAETHSGLILN